MDFAKLDAPLAAALEGASKDEQLDVSIRTDGPLGDRQQDELRTLGVRGVEGGRTIFSATVSVDTARLLSEKAWVRRISLAHTLRPLAR